MAIQKLELTWIGKDKPEQKIEPRILIDDAEKSYGESGTGNMLIHGDNLLALRALLPKYGGMVKCIYIANLSSDDHVIGVTRDGCCCSQYRIRKAC